MTDLGVVSANPWLSVDCNPAIPPNAQAGQRKDQSPRRLGRCQGVREMRSGRQAALKVEPGQQSARRAYCPLLGRLRLSCADSNYTTRWTADAGSSLETPLTVGPASQHGTSGSEIIDVVNNTPLISPVGAAFPR
jgi:hypothetical protein